MIIVLVTPTGTFLAADDKIVTPGGSPEVEYGCKIHQRDYWFWAAAGLDDDRITGFHVEDFVGRAASKEGAEATLARFTALIEGPLQAELPVMRRLNAGYYERLMKGHNILTLVLVTPHEVDARGEDFKVFAGGVFPRAWNPCVHTPCLHILPEELQSYVVSHREIWSMPPVAGIDTLIAAGHRIDPKFIGTTGAILLFDNRGARWIRRDKCEPIRKTTLGAQRRRNHQVREANR